MHIDSMHLAVGEPLVVVYNYKPYILTFNHNKEVINVRFNPTNVLCESVLQNKVKM